MSRMRWTALRRPSTLAETFILLVSHTACLWGTSSAPTAQKEGLVSESLMNDDDETFAASSYQYIKL